MMCILYTFSENEAIDYGGHTGRRVAYVNNQRGTLPCGKTTRVVFSRTTQGQRQVRKEEGGIRTDAFKTPVFAM
jgi:hypothetical protein